MDPYQSCPCGSGKSFKWCCQSYYQLVEKSRKQHQDGQHEAALRTIGQLVEQNPRSAPVLGYQAELLYMNGKTEDADEAIQKAFAIDPNFPLGHWIRGIIRRNEGEIIGALIQFRKALELYDPKANEVLAELSASIFDIEMKLNRPVAARAALDRAVQYDPSVENLKKAHETLFGPDSRLPECACKAYAFRPAIASRQSSWASALEPNRHGRLSEAQTAFEKLTAEDANDAPAWFNLGLVRAWLGDNVRAVEALQKSVELESEPARNAESGALIEVLRCGEGMKEQSDHREYRIFFQLQQPQPLIQLLEQWHGANRLSGSESDQESGTFSTLVLEETAQFGDGEGTPVAKLAGYLLVVENVVRLWSPRKESVNKLAAEMLGKVGQAITSPTAEEGYCSFADIASEALLFPTRPAQLDEISDKLQDQAQTFFEEVWVQRPLHALGGMSPIAAAESGMHTKKLLGVVKFIQDCFIGASPRVSDGKQAKIAVMYDFNRLRHKLGLAAEGAAPSAEAGPKFASFSAAELGALKSEELSDQQLDEAFRASLQLEEMDLAGQFARDIIQRPAGAGITDRYLYFNYLIQLAATHNDVSAIMTTLDQAEKADAESNEGRRRNDYVLRRGQALAKHGDVERAHQVFQELLTREPNELKFYGPATETMLGQKKGPWAVEFAEQGLAKARSQNNRDSEQYFLELLAAAKKLN